ncbi:MAG: phage tail tape measure protein [Pseudolabrys sp.]
MAATDNNGNEFDALASGSALDATVNRLNASTNALVVSTNSFSTAMARAFTQASVGGKQFDDVLKGLALRVSSLAVTQAFKPITGGIAGGLNSLFSGLFLGGGASDLKAAMGAVKPFAAGGVIGTPSYFPLASGGLGLAGEAGPEAIMPLSRGPDGRLGVASSGGGSPSIIVHISTPDAASFRRSEAYVTGQIARAVARGQRSL